MEPPHVTRGDKPATPPESSAASVFESHRRYLQGLAYRMLGSVADAQDAVQESYLRWIRAPRDEVRATRSWLAKTCSRICLDKLKSAHKKRETYVGQWLPEPWLDDGDGPQQRAELDESLSMGLMLLLERLSPAERASFLLHDVFGYGFDEVADMLDRNAASCRQLASRARRQVRVDRPRFEPHADDARRLTEAFMHAIREGDLAALTGLLSEDAVLRSDGGGKAVAAGRVLRGRDTVARFLVGVARKPLPKGAQPTLRMRWYNGAPGLIAFVDHVAVSAFSLDFGEHGIRALDIQRNPDKLAHFYLAPN